MDKAAKFGEDRVKLRQEQSAPVLSELHEKFVDWKEQVLPKHLMAEASPILRSGQPGLFSIRARRLNSQQQSSAGAI